MRASARLFLDVVRQPGKMTELGVREWNQVLPIARSTEMISRLGAQAEMLDLYPALPNGPAMQLRDSLLLADHQWHSMLWEIDRIRRVLEYLDTPIVLLKGAAYIAAGLPTARGRVCNDTDILVRRECLAQVETALLHDGWETDEPDLRHQRFYRLWAHEIPPLKHIDRGTILDMHHNLIPPADWVSLDIGKVLDSATPIEDLGVSVPSPVDMVLHAAVHQYRNGDYTSGLRDLSDIDILLRHFSRDDAFWGLLLERARELNLRSSCFYAIYFARSLFSTSVPDPVMETIAAWKPRLLDGRWFVSMIERAIMPRHDNRPDTLRDLSLRCLDLLRPRRPRFYLSPLLWTKRLPSLSRA